MSREFLRIEIETLNEINDFLLDEDNPLINDLLEIIDKHGGVEEINRKAAQARRIDDIMSRLERSHPSHVRDLEWMIKQRDGRRFVSLSKYCERVLGNDYVSLEGSPKVTLEISACNFFPWLVEEAKRAIEREDLMPARYITTRSIKEQVEDGDLPAFTAAMQIIGSSHVETLDTKGTMPGPDGQPINIHLGGPETLAGYFGGVGMPNRYALRWVDELLHYYTEYGVQEFLNLNLGTVLLGFWLYKLGINVRFKISVFLGHDNPYYCLLTLMIAKFFSRSDGTTPLSGLNLSNSVDTTTLESLAYIRKRLGFEDKIRIEHHITETYRGIVRQPYDRLDQLLEIADHVKNLSAKHEGSLPEVELRREHPSDVLDYFIPKEEIVRRGLMKHLLLNYLDKHDSVNRTARALIKNGIGVVAAEKLHE